MSRGVSEWVIKFNGVLGDIEHQGPYSPYKLCNHNLYIISKGSLLSNELTLISAGTKKCEFKLLIYSPISSHILQIMWLLIHAGIKIKIHVS